MKKPFIWIAVLVSIVCMLCCAFSFSFMLRRVSKDDIDMTPNLAEKDLVVISRSLDKLKRGRIVLVNHDGEENLLRVIGVGGDTVEIRNKEEVYVNGDLYVPARFIDYNPEYKFGTYTIDEGHVFVLGDNRSRSHDSGNFGQIPLSEISGVVRLTFVAKEPDWSLYPMWDSKGNRIDSSARITMDDF